MKPSFRGPALFAALMVIAWTPHIHAEGINLTWDSCGYLGTLDKTFSCDTNAGTNDIHVSYDPPSVLPNVNGVFAILDLQSASPSLPPWWYFKNAGTCRMTSLSVSGVLGDPYSTCLDSFSGQGVGGVNAYQVTATTPSMAANRARIFASVGAASPFHTEVDPGNEYFAMRIRINNARTVGSESCAGCLGPVCLLLTSVQLSQPPGWPGGDPFLTNPLASNYVTWQGGAVGGSGCPGVTPALNHTWGQIKSLYR